MGRVSNRLDGVTYEAWKGRFNGSVELEETEADGAAMGDVGVGVVVYRITDVGSKLDKDGILTRVPVFTVTDFRSLEEDLKELLVERLGLVGSDTTDVPIRIVPGERTETQRVASVNVDTGEIQGALEFGESEDEDYVQVDDDYTDELAPEGPRTVPMAPYRPEVVESDHVTLGEIPVKDSVLANALQNDSGWH